jgi:hypothetical protein
MAMNELIIRALCDVRPETAVNGAVLFSQTSDNQNSVFSAAKNILAGKLAEKILVVKSAPVGGYPGFSIWKSELSKIGIKSNKILGVEIMKKNSLNTLIESKAIINYAVQKGYHSLYVVSSPFHQLRAFMTLVTVTLRYFPDLSIFSYTGVTLPWLDKVVHSQGTLSGTRKSFIKAEFDRIDKYQRKGDLASEREIIKYLNRRDKGFN